MKSEKARYVFGTLTITAVIGITVYAIVEYKRVVKQQEEVITVEEAKAEIKSRQDKEIEDRYESGEIDGHREEMVEVGLHEYENPQEITEEDEILRHDPNSPEAREQFIFMNLAEWQPNSDEYNTLLYLFTFPFNPKTEGDKILRERLVDERMNFFGDDSKWNARVTWADVVLYFARTAEFNLDSTVNFWTGHFLANMEISHLMSSDRIDDILDDLTKHYYFNSNGDFGMFALDEDALDSAYKTADEQLDTDLTLDIEFNEFLQRVNTEWED